MAKQNPYRFSLGFDEEDPDHQEVARILNQLGHRKAKFVVKAVLAYHQNIEGKFSKEQAVIEKNFRKRGKMRNRVEYILGGMTILQGLLVGMAWNGKKWAFLLLTLFLLLQEMVLILLLVRKRYQKKFCPKCGIEIIIWYRICPNCGHIFKPGCKKEDLTEMIEDALDQEEIGEFDQLENSTDRMEEIEECMIERYIHNEKNI